MSTAVCAVDHGAPQVVIPADELVQDTLDPHGRSAYLAIAEHQSPIHLAVPTTDRRIGHDRSTIAEDQERIAIAGVGACGLAVPRGREAPAMRSERLDHGPVKIRIPESAVTLRGDGARSDGAVCLTLGENRGRRTR